MKSLMRLWASLLIVSYGATLLLPAVALAATAPPPHPTCTLSINPSVIAPGGGTTINWTSTNATAGAITNVGNVAPSGSKQITPPLAQITVYVGSFTGPGGTANCTASVQVSYGTAVGGTDTTGASGGSVTTGSSANSAGSGVSAGSGLVTPNPISAAGSGGSGSAGTQPALVQCGGAGQPGGATGCEACNLAQLVQNIINFMIGLSIPIAAVLFAWAGILYFTSGASPGNMEKAKGIFSNALIGFLIAITAWLIVNTLLHALLDNGLAGFNQGNWFTVQCSQPNSRPVSGDISQVINSILPTVNTAPPQIAQNAPLTTGTSPYACGTGYTLANQGGFVSCNAYDSSGGILNSVPPLCTSGGSPNSNGQCTDQNGVAVLPGTSYGSSGGLCANDNTACSPAALQQTYGYSPEEANAMSCIAITESGGNPYTKPSNTGACGLFQITNRPGNWSNSNYHAGDCSAATSCNDPACNAQTANLMFNEQGYQPWTGVDPKTGQPWNQNARNCVQKYDNQAFIDQVQ